MLNTFTIQIGPRPCGGYYSSVYAFDFIGKYITHWLLYPYTDRIGAIHGALGLIDNSMRIYTKNNSSIYKCYEVQQCKTQ